MDVAEVFIDSYEGLLPGKDPCIDMMCRGVLCDEPFENPKQPK